MVNPKKNKTATAESDAKKPFTYNGIEITGDDLPDAEFEKLVKRCCWFYSCDILTNDIIEYCKSKFEKSVDALDIMNVAIFTLHGIVKAESDSDKKHILEMISGMVNDKYHLNEWIYKMSAVIKANDKTLCDAIVTGDIDDIDSKVDKAIKQAEYKAWNTELSVIKRKQSAKELVDNIVDDVAGGV